MIDKEQAKNLALKTVVDFVAQCHCETNTDAANVLTLLASTCGLGIVKAEGVDSAVIRLTACIENITFANIDENGHVSVKQVH